MVDELVESDVSAPTSATTLRTNIMFVAKGGGITFIGKMFLAISRLLVAVILARLLDAQQYGLYRLSLSAANIAVVLAVFGLDTALIRYIAILDHRDDDAGVWGTLQIGIGVSTALSVITGTLLYAFSFPLAVSLFDEPALAPILQIVSVVIPILALSEVLAGATRGFKRMDAPVVARFIAKPIIRLGLVLGLMLFNFNVTLAIVTYGFADLCSSIILFYYLNKEFPFRKPFTRVRYDTREILSFSFPVWLSGMMVKFQGNIQTILLGSLDTIVGVGLFSVANQITRVSSEFSSSINTAAKPIVAELYDQGNLKQMGQIYQIANKWAIIIQLPIFLVMVLLPEQILSIFGQSFTDGATALVILAFAGLVQVGTGMGGIIIDMTGYAKLKLANAVFRLTLYLGLNLLLIPKWGLLGGVVAVLIGHASINLLRLLQIAYLFRMIPYNKTFLKPIAAGGIALVTFYSMVNWLTLPSMLVNEIIATLVMLMIYVLSLYLLGFTAEEYAMMRGVTQRLRTKYKL